MFGGEKVEIKAECKMYLLDTVIEEFGDNLTIKKINDDKFILTTNSSIIGFKVWAMRNIDSATVISPVNLKNELKEIIENANKQYK